MKLRPEVRITVIDQFGSRAVVELKELDRTCEHWGIARILAEAYGEQVTNECPACGTDVLQAVESGLMGCPCCYSFVYSDYRAQVTKLATDSNPIQDTSNPNQVS